MRTSISAIALLLCLSSTISAQSNPPPASPGGPGSNPQPQPLQLPSPTSSTLSTSAHSTSSSVTSTARATSSFVTSSLRRSSTSSIEVSSSLIPTSASTSASTILSSPSSTATPSSDSSHLSRTWVIVLATVIPVVVVALLALASLCIYRYRRGRSPFSSHPARGHTPIDDDEIATWRGKHSVITAHTRFASEGSSDFHLPIQHGDIEKSGVLTKSRPSQIQVTRSPSWTWSAATTTASPITPKKSLEQMSPPAVVARAPNSRFGLTDETIPGDEPYISSSPTLKNSSRLHKSRSSSQSQLFNTPRAKSRGPLTKSRASSLSISHSAHERSYSTWYDPEDSIAPAAFPDMTRNSQPVVHSRNWSATDPALNANDDWDFQMGGLSPPPSARMRGMGGRGGGFL